MCDPTKTPNPPRRDEMAAEGRRPGVRARTTTTTNNTNTNSNNQPAKVASITTKPLPPPPPSGMAQLSGRWFHGCLQEE